MGCGNWLGLLCFQGGYDDFIVWYPSKKLATHRDAPVRVGYSRPALLASCFHVLFVRAQSAMSDISDAASRADLLKEKESEYNQTAAGQKPTELERMQQTAQEVSSPCHTSSTRVHRG